MSYFSTNYSRLNFPISTTDARGLRKAQLGAIHAIGAHFTLHEDEPSLVVMPTGSGKTAVLNITPYLLRSKRVLVISSTMLVRGQIADEFKTLKTLKGSSVFHQDLPTPEVKEIKSPIKNSAEWESLSDFDVVVGIPNSLNEGINDDFKPAPDLFDLVLVDEAHHVPAFTWTSIVNSFPDAKKIFFTATPFRRDRKEIKGRLIYNYPVSKAYEDKIFGDIGYYAVVTDNPNIDLAIAKEAEKIFNADQAAGLEHFIMVRTENKEKAKELELLYSTETNLTLKRIDSSVKYKTILKTIKDLREGKLDGIICVDMLGEGFDFPNLKIAAIHSPKKSLSNTLQFIGRFARTNAEHIGEAKFISAPNDIEIGKKKLYREGAIWNDIIKNLSEEIIEEEDEIKNVLDTFEVETSSSKGPISLYNINPYCHVKVYKAAEIDLEAKVEIIGKEVVYHFISQDHNATFFILRETQKPKWMASKDLANVKYYFILVFFDEENNLLFIHSSIRTYQFYDYLVNQFAPNGHTRISKYQLNKVLADITETEFFNIGMQNRSANSGESYRTMAGPNAENAIRKSHSKNYANGHVFMKGNSEGKKITIGYSSGSKVWSNSYLKIPDFIKWCKVLAEKIVSNKVVRTNTGFDNLPIGMVVDRFPTIPHGAIWNSESFSEIPTLFVLDDDELKLKCSLFDLEIVLNKDQTSQDALIFDLVVEDIEITIKYTFTDHFEYVNEPEFDLLIDNPEDNISLLDYLNENPLTIFLDDFGTIINHDYYPPPKEEDFQYNSDKITSHNWAASNTDITKEFYENVAEKAENANQNSIHESLNIKLQGETYSVVIYDHGTGEVADYITFTETENRIDIVLYHVKKSGGATPGDRVADLYEVCMQAVKSQIWTTSKASFTKKIIARVTGHAEKFIIGDLTDFQRIMGLSKSVKFIFTIVQPGVSHTSMTPKLSYLLASADDTINNNGFEFLVLGS